VCDITAWKIIMNQEKGGQYIRIISPQHMTGTVLLPVGKSDIET